MGNPFHKINSLGKYTKFYINEILHHIKMLPLYIKRSIIILGRFIEYILTGEAEFKFHTPTGAEFDAVTDKYKAKLLEEEVEVYLRRNFGIKLKEPVIIELYSHQFDFQGILMELRGTVGRYHQYKMGKSNTHMIYIKKGLPCDKFKSILAHEITHAYIREKELMNCDRYLREGFARWIEYSYLIDHGLKEEAEKILRLKSYSHGANVKKLLELEKKVGRYKAIDILNKID